MCGWVGCGCGCVSDKCPSHIRQGRCTSRNLSLLSKALACGFVLASHPIRTPGTFPHALGSVLWRDASEWLCPSALGYTRSTSTTWSFFQKRTRKKVARQLDGLPAPFTLQKLKGCSVIAVSPVSTLVKRAQLENLLRSSCLPLSPSLSLTGLPACWRALHVYRFASRLLFLCL